VSQKPQQLTAEIVEQFEDPDFAEYAQYSVSRIQSGDIFEQKVLASIKQYPVSLKTFVSDPYYLGNITVYPLVLEELEKLNNPPIDGLPHGLRIGNTYTESVFTGAIGSGKSHCAIITLVYQLYILSCLHNPQDLFDLDTSSEILFVIQTLNQTLAKQLDYARLKAMLESSLYFKEQFPFNPQIESELQFPNRIIVRPVSGSETATIGQNVFGGILDEVNYMEHVEHSKKTHDGNTYDQATALYNSVASRRKSRFLKHGRLFGMLCLVSSKRYPDQFTDRKVAEAKKELSETGKTSIYVYDKTRWDIKPDDFCGEKFRVFKGDQSRKARILGEHEKADPHLILEVPIEYRTDFETDLLRSLRDIGGVSTLATHPFLPNTELISASFGEVVSILSVESSDFQLPKVSFVRSRIQYPEQPRFIHVDLALSNDSAGIACGYVSAFDTIDRGGGHKEVLPEITVDFALEIHPPKTGEIDIARIRKMIFMLRDSLGVNVKWVSYDQYQSAESLQILRLNRFTTGQRSMHKTPIPYEVLKQAIYDGRVKIPKHKKLRKELVELEFDAKKNKIDHPIPNGSDDVSDCLAGVVYGLSIRREVWARWGVLSNTFEEYIRREEKKHAGEISGWY